MNKFILAVLFILMLSKPCLISANPLELTRAFLAEKRLTANKEVSLTKEQKKLVKEISQARDPQTKFFAYIYGLNKEKVAFLDKAQKEQLVKMLEVKKTSTNWHDVRNLIRLHHMISMWETLKQTDLKKRATASNEMEQWLNLFLDFMFQEFIAKERFQREFWQMLSIEQRQKIQTGECDKFIKKNVGHKRDFSSDKVIAKTLGKATDKKQFSKLVDSLKENWQVTFNQCQKSERFERQRSILLDKQDEQFSIWAWQRYAESFKAFKKAEFDAISALIKAYPNQAENQKRITNYQKKLRQSMLQKYKSGAGDLLKLLGYY